MGSDGASAAFRGLDDQFQLVERECGLGFTVWSPSEIGVDLDPVGASADLIANDTSQAVDAIGFFGALRNAPLRRITLRCIAAGCDDRACDGEHARTRDDAL